MSPAMGLTWQLQTGVILFLLAISSGSGDDDVVYVAYPSNLVYLLHENGSTSYRTVVGQTVEQNFFIQADGLDCDKSNEMLCWTEKEYNFVRCSNPSPTPMCTDDTTHLKINNIITKGEPKDVALDPCHMMLYWTDPGRSTIGVVRIKRDEQLADTIVPVASTDILTSEDGLVKPESIAVDSCDGHIFYTDVGTLVPKVAKARTDGSNIQTLATKSPSEQALRTPTALALNRQSKTIYFGDMSLGEIFKMTYDGENLEKVSEAATVYDLALGCNYERIVFNSLLSVNPTSVLFDGSDKHGIILPKIGPKLYRGACSYCKNCQCDTYCSHDNGGCSHLCLEQPDDSAPKCGCPPGYILDKEDNKNCIVETPQLLVANSSNVLLIKPNSIGGMNGTPKELALGYLRGVYGVDYVERDGHQYAIVADISSLKRLNFDGSGGVTIVRSLSGLRGVAADCVTGNIYYCQMTKGVISVTDLQGTVQHDCYSNLLKPFAVVLNTKKGTLYYTGIGLTSIYEASMDCSGVPTPRVRSLALPTGLALDNDRQVLYWNDFAYGLVQSYNLNTGQTSTVTTGSRLHMQRPLDLTLYGNYLYFTDWGSGSVGSVSTQDFTVGGVHHIPGSKMHGIAHLPKNCKNPTNGGSCSKCKDSEMCMLSSDNGGSIKCHCPPGFGKVEGELECQVPDKDFILVSARHSIALLSLSGTIVSDGWIAQLPLTPQKNILALDFDYDAKRVFWTDTTLRKIFSANLNGTNFETLLAHDPTRDVCRLCSSYGLAYDRTTQRLYYTDASAGEICSIYVNSATPYPVRVLGGLDNPRAIIIQDGNPKKLYFSELGNGSRISSVDIAILTPNPEVVVSNGLTSPTALALSRDGSKLYFGDSTEDYIAYYSFQSQTVVRLSNATHVFDMDEFTGSDGQAHLFWSDSYDGVFKMPVSGGNAELLASPNDVHWASGIKVFTRGE